MPTPQIPPGFNQLGESPPSDLSVASAIQGAPNDPSVLAMKPQDRAAQIARIENVIARGTGRDVDYWRTVSIPSLVSPYASYEQHNAALDKAIEKETHGVDYAPAATGGLATIPTAPDPGSIESREIERAQRFGTSKKPQFSQPFFNQPVLNQDTRFRHFPTAPTQLPSAVGPSTFPQPPHSHG